jgi:uncharacterized spore protein YtfJ
MSEPPPFTAISDILQRSLNIHHVYGEPVVHGNTTVIPVAQLAYGFGGGGGRGPGTQKPRYAGRPTDADGSPDAEGMGGGGGARMTPVGALEIRADGVRFIRFRPLGPMAGVAAVGMIVGWWFGRRSRRAR